MTHTFEAHMGSKLAARRRALNLSEADLADKVGVMEVRLARWEAGAERIPADLLLLLATKLKCDLRYFFEGMDGIPEKTRPYLRLIAGTGTRLNTSKDDQS